MTIVDVKNALFTHFLTETSFSLKGDVAAALSASSVPEELVEHKEALCKAALDDYTRSGITVEVAPGVYVLTQPIDQMTQQVALSPLAAELIAGLVNGVAADTNDARQGDPANKLAITSGDIEQVCHFCHFLLDEQTETNGNPA